MRTRRDRGSAKKSNRLERDTTIFRLLVESAPNAIVVVDHLGIIVLVNAGTEKLFGYSRSELLGQSIEILVPEAVRSAHLEDRTKYIKHPATRAMGAGRDLYGLHKNGRQVPVEIGLSPFKMGKHPMIL